LDGASAFASQRDITEAISWLFFSSIIMWPLPWIPIEILDRIGADSRGVVTLDHRERRRL
jgi:hypothetical protein